MSPAGGKSEILVIRRGRGGAEEGHHGGVWKIAYADFMTAMMAFFLVMWLVNASNEETKTQVASYFNPVKLIDTRTNKKGLQSMDTGAGESWERRDPSGAFQTNEKPEEKTGHEPVAPSEANPKPSSEDASRRMTPASKSLTDPLNMRDSLAPANAGQQAEDNQGAMDFAAPVQRTPSTPEDLLALIVPETELLGVRSSDKQNDPQSDPEASSGEAGDAQQQQQQLEQAGTGQSPQTTDMPPDERQSQPYEQQVLAMRTKGDARPDVDYLDKHNRLRENEMFSGVVPDEIRQGIELLNESRMEGGLRVSVEKVEGGYLVSLTEGAVSPMFGIATAEPSTPLRELTQKLGKQLQNMPGKIVVRGHTDGRNYDTGEADNWSLSSDRAHAAYRLLLQAGVPNDRFDRIEGYADTRLKKLDEPLDAANRRVEIFIEQMKKN